VPRLSVWFIRTSLLYLGLGFTLGALLLFNKGVPLTGALWQLLPVHVEFVLVGWTIQLALGVAFWILPRWRSSRGNEALAWLAYGLLNAGVLAAGVGPGLGWPPLIGLLGRGAELLAALAFALHAWPRVKALGA
jgi:hypothetical protein